MIIILYRTEHRNATDMFTIQKETIIMLYPLVMQPHFRHGVQTPWGGDSLSMFGKDIPDSLTGESLEISALADTPSIVKNGPLAGRTLSSLMEEYGAQISGCEGEFPLLVKLIDARDMLSVQVHPGDEYATAKHGKLGKTEAWLVLSCAPGAQLCCGIKEDAAPFEELCADEVAMQNAMRRVSVMPGDVLYIPHGLVHAIGAGIMVYEIQQSSDVTYRISDWGRMGADGKPRQLHLDDAKAVVRPEIRPDKSVGASLVVEGGVKTAYVCDERFELWRLNISGDMPLPSGRMQLVTAMSPCSVKWDGGCEELMPGESVLVPAVCENVHLIGRAQAILSSTPDQAALREALGQRASAVAGL